MFTPLLRSDNFRQIPVKNNMSDSIMKVTMNRHKQRLAKELHKRELYPPRNNLMVKLLSAVSSDWDEVDMFRHMRAFKFTTPVDKGRVHKNVFHRENVSEILIADKEGDTGRDAPIIDIVYYPFAGMVPPLPNGRPFLYPDGVVIYNININMLLKTYKLYLKGVEGNKEVKDIRFFIFKFVTQPLLTRLVDASMLNEYMAYILEKEPIYVEANIVEMYHTPYIYKFSMFLSKMRKPYYNSVVTVEDMLNKNYLPFAGGAEVARIPPIANIPRYHWILLFSMLDKIEYLTFCNKNKRLSNFELDLMMVKINAKRIKTTLRQFIPVEIINHVLPKINSFLKGYK